MRPRSVIGIVGLAVGCATTLAAQGQTRCDMSTKGPSSSEIIGGQEITSGAGGITVVCRSKNITLVADSGRKTGEDRVDLFGHVHYVEASRIDLQSDFLTYYQRDERVLVTGHVIAVLPNGSRLVGPEATYLRVVPKVRTIEELTAVRNPTVTIASNGDTTKAITINARTIYMRGDSLTYASRDVVILRSDLITHSDSAFLDGRPGKETIRLMYNPSIEGLQGRKFRLQGEIIDAYSTNRKLDRVIARGKGHATSQDLEIVSDTLDLRMSNDAMERAIAWSSPGQARATSPSQSIVADSIDVVMPKQKVQVVYAVRRARADAAADTVRFRTTEKDWLSGDTVIAWFDTTATKDTSSTPPIRRIFATNTSDSARAYYHLAPNDTGTNKPAIAYIIGREIRLDFDHRKVALVAVRDSVAGVYLEPKRDSTAKPATTKLPGKKPPVASANASANASAAALRAKGGIHD